VLDRALARRGHGPCAIQAGIASLHAGQPPDWPQIAALYGELARLTPSPVVELNRAIAVAETEGPDTGLDIIDRIGLDNLHHLHAARGELLRRAGRLAEARAAYQRALAPGRRCRKPPAATAIDRAALVTGTLQVTPA
jgi:RNA polymerase sigma-70 factor (ECF subfamily)